MPESLMQDFCVFQKPGDDVEGLSKAYHYNTICGRKYQTQLIEQRQYNNKVKQAQEGPKSGAGGTK